MTRQKPKRPERIHHVLGTLGFISLLVLIIIDSFPQYTVSSKLAAMLAVSYLIFLGFGALFSQYIEAKYDGN